MAGVPALLQALDWYVHRLTGAPVTGKALLSISVFTLISAVFHLHVMRNGVFLSGRGNSLVNDFRRIPALIAGFAMKPLTLFAGIESRIGMKVENG